jgi:hypothetical protein
MSIERHEALERDPRPWKRVITLVLITVPLWGWLVWWAAWTTRKERERCGRKS